MKNFLIKTYGCQMNIAESLKVKKYLESFNLKETQDILNTDIFIINSCAVRGKSEEKVYSLLGIIKKIKKEKKDLKVVLMGCVASLQNNKRLKDFSLYIDLILEGFNPIDSNIEKIEMFLKDTSYNLKNTLSFETEIDSAILKSCVKDVRKFVPVIYGCDSFCTYCVVPYAKGKERSLPLEHIIEEIKTFSMRDGVAEIVLLGQNINHYGKDIGLKDGFKKLLISAGSIESIKRIRFLTSHPKDFSYDVVDTVSFIEKIENHFHLPVQSGSDKILKLMNRGYSIDEYKRLVDYIRKKYNRVSITTDIITGFPQETEEDFKNTLKLIREIRFDMVFLASYSDRPNVSSSKLDFHIDERVKKERHKIALDLINSIIEEKNKEYIGTTVDILIENTKNNKIFGRSSEDKLIIGSFSSSNKVNSFITVGKIAKVFVKDADSRSLKGEAIN